MNVVENYEIVQKIGEGTFSEVFLARNKISNSPVALKKLKIETFTEEDIKLCFNEILLLKLINSDHVIACNGAFKVSKDVYISLEYADSGDLQNYIDTRRENGKLISERAIWFYFHQICDGLKALHSKRILHRDLKPANIFIKSDGKAKIGDLGLSRIFTLKTQLAKTAVGTEYYLAPERNTQGGYHFKSDIWALGCILYELATLRSPFNGEQQNVYALYKRIETCQYPPIPAKCYSRQLHFFISSCLRVKSEKRPDVYECHIAAELMHKKFSALRTQFKKQFGK